MSEAGRKLCSPEISVNTWTDEFLNGQGKKIFCYYWEPSQKPRASVFIRHGFTDHTLVYEDLALELARRGFFVFAHDFVGHGKSEGIRGHINSHQYLVDDMLLHIDLVKKKFPNLPIFMCGHSLGGSTSILCSLKRPQDIKGMVLLAPALLPNPETAALKIGIAKMISRIIPQFPLIYADVTLSSRDKDKIKKMDNDPLRYHGYFKARSTACILDAGEECCKKKKSVDVPFLILHGDDDKVCDVSASKLLHEHSPAKDKTLKVYSKAYHSLLQEPDEVSDDVFKTIIEWLELHA